jgi:hypothetical protein
LSLAVAEKLTTREHSPGEVVVAMLAGHVIVGGVVSLMVTVNVHGVPLLSQVTEVFPTGKKDPDGGLQNMGSLPQLPDLVGNVATAPH